MIRQISRNTSHVTMFLPGCRKINGIDMYLDHLIFRTPILPSTGLFMPNVQIVTMYQYAQRNF